MNVKRQDFAGLALHDYFQRAATDFTIYRQPLKRDAGVNRGFKCLSAIGAADSFDRFHLLHDSVPIIAPIRQGVPGQLQIQHYEGDRFRSDNIGAAGKFVERIF